MITQKQIDQVKLALDKLAPVIEEPITYLKFTNNTPGDPVKGTPEQPNYNDIPTTAKVRDLTLEEVQVSGGTYVLGDMEFKVRGIEKPSYSDRIIHDDGTFKPKKIGKLWLGEVIYWKIKAGKV